MQRVPFPAGILLQASVYFAFQKGTISHSFYPSRL